MADTALPLLEKEPRYEEQILKLVTSIRDSLDILTFLSKDLSKINDNLDDISENTEPDEEEDIGKNKKTNEYLQEISQNLKTSGKETAHEVGKFAFKTLLGPLRLITEPLEEFTKFNIFENISSGIKGLGKEFKGTLTRDQIKKIDPGVVWLYDQEHKEKEEEKKKDGLKGLLSSNFLKAIPPGLVKGFGIASLAAGLIWMAIDGIRGWMKAKKWGTTKVASGIGGALGGMSKGMEGAFKNMGKWALIGAGIGTLIAPVIGTIAGGILGAAIGGILGYIGGENIAKGIDKLTNWIDSIFDVKKIIEMSPIGAIIKYIEDMKKTWADPKKTIGEKIGEAIGGLYKIMFNILTFPARLITDLITGKAFKKDGQKKLSKSFFEVLKSIGGFVFDIFKGITKSLGINTIISNIAKTIFDILLTPFKLGKKAAEFTKYIGESIKDFLGNVFESIKEFALSTPLLKDLVKGLFSIFDFFGDMFGFIKKKGIGILGDIISGKDVTKEFAGYKQEQEKIDKIKEDYENKLKQLYAYQKLSNVAEYSKAQKMEFEAKAKQTEQEISKMQIQAKSNKEIQQALEEVSKAYKDQGSSFAEEMRDTFKELVETIKESKGNNNIISIVQSKFSSDSERSSLRD